MNENNFYLSKFNKYDKKLNELTGGVLNKKIKKYVRKTASTIKIDKWKEENDVIYDIIINNNKLNNKSNWYVHHPIYNEQSNYTLNILEKEKLYNFIDDYVLKNIDNSILTKKEPHYNADIINEYELQKGDSSDDDEILWNNIQLKKSLHKKAENNMRNNGIYNENEFYKNNTYTNVNDKSSDSLSFEDFKNGEIVYAIYTSDKNNAPPSGLFRAYYLINGIYYRDPELLKLINDIINKNYTWMHSKILNTRLFKIVNGV
jgi:hypothetical protein